MANLRLSTAKESEDTLKAFTSPTGPKGQSRRTRFASVYCIPSCRNNVVEVAADVGKFIE